MLRALALIVTLLIVDPSIEAAQAQIRVRGAIEKVEDHALTVKSRDGQSVTIKLNPNFNVLAVTQATFADIRQGAFVGAAALRQPDGTFKAQEVVIFPEAMRGTGEGHYTWDLTPDSTMTNATVDAVVTDVDGPLLTLKHKDGDVKVMVPTSAPVVTLGPGDKSLLAPGVAVFVPVARAEDGSLSAGRVLAGKDGLVPPM
jgi:hypothetical protein